MLQLLIDYQFARHALVTGVMIGLIAPLVGMFVVARRLSAIGEVLSHMSLAGIAIGSMIGSSVGFFGPKFFGLIFAVIGAFLVEGLRRAYRHYAELAIPVLLSFGIGLGVVLFSLMNGFNADLAGFLFGNLLAVTSVDVVLTGIITAIILLVLLALYKELLAVTFDEEFAVVGGIRSSFIQFIFVVLIALTISVTVQAVGVMLVSGLMVLPVAGGMAFANGFKQALILSVAISEASVLLGLVLAYHFDLSTGGTIIMVAFGFLLLALLYTKWISKHLLIALKGMK